MRITMVVDANPILSALLGGYARKIFFDRRFEFVTTEFTLAEVKKYLPLVAEKSGVKLEEILLALSLLPIKVISRPNYVDSLSQARQILKDIDLSDVDILALALEINSYLWTNDKHFEKIMTIPLIRIIKTKDFV